MTRPPPHTASDFVGLGAHAAGASVAPTCPVRNGERVRTVPFVHDGRVFSGTAHCLACSGATAERVSVGRVALGYVEDINPRGAGVAPQPPPGATVWVMIGVRRYTIPADKAEALRQFVAALGGEVVG